MEKKEKYAYVTFIMRGDNYIPGALVLAYCLRKQLTKADIVCLVTNDVSSNSKIELLKLYDYVVNIDEIFVKHNYARERRDREYLFTRFNVLRLGKNGGLGFNYDKIVVLDADLMPISRFDELFEINTPAGIINECKEHFINSNPRKDGKWQWHDIYGDICKHGELIPKTITDRVWKNPDNMGVNSCIWVLKPEKKEFDMIIKTLNSPSVKNKVSCFKWPEMQYATYFWSGRWHNIDIRFGAFNCQSKLDLIYGTHFAGLKPWNYKNVRSLVHYYKYDDYRLWYKLFIELTQWIYPSFQKLPKIKQLIKFYEKKLEL